MTITKQNPKTDRRFPNLTVVFDCPVIMCEYLDNTTVFVRALVSTLKFDNI